MERRLFSPRVEPRRQAGLAGRARQRLFVDVDRAGEVRRAIEDLPEQQRRRRERRLLAQRARQVQTALSRAAAHMGGGAGAEEREGCAPFGGRA